MAQNNTKKTAIATVVADWKHRVNQGDPAALAKFISDMPNAKTITHQELTVICDEAVDYAALPPANVVLESGEILVEPASLKGEKFYCFGGTHASYGNFALFWSARGPDGGSRERPCFLFWDDEAVMLKPGYAA